MIMKVTGSVIDTFTASKEGSVPPPINPTGLFLRDDGTWAAASGGISDYGEMYFTENATVTDMNDTALYFEIEGTYSADTLSGFTHSSGRLTSTNGGTFLCLAHASYRALPGAVLYFSVHVNGSQQGNLIGESYQQNEEEMADVTVSGLLSLSASDIVDLRIRRTTGTNNRAVRHLNVTLIKLAA